GIPLLDGRTFTDRDRERAPYVAVVNETFVKRFFGGRRSEAIGAHAQLGATVSPTEGPDGAPLVQLVGVGGDTEPAYAAALAPALSLIGVYGVMAYTVSERTHELGVRMALGASPADIRALVVGQGTRLAAIGIAIGIGGALATSRALGALLFGVSATDPATFA